MSASPQSDVRAINMRSIAVESHSVARASSIYVLVEVAGAPNNYHPNSEQDADSENCFHLFFP
jgi:hypothetical protein